MKFKSVWILFAILMLVFMPLRVISSYSSINIGESWWFTAAFLILLLGVWVLASFEKLSMKNIEIYKNVPLGVVSLVVAASFFWCISTYYTDKSQYDLEWQPVIMGLLSILTCIAFLVMSAVHFTGKNYFSKASFLIFCPVFWFAFDMMLFLSIQNTHTNIYNISLTAFLSLFSLYYTQVFSTSSKQNIIKLIVGFGIPAVVLSVARCIHALIYVIGNKYVSYTFVMSDVELSTCAMEAALAVYIFLVILEVHRQVSKETHTLNSIN